MKNLLSLILLITSFSVMAQQEAANWYFGENAGIRFDATAGTVTALSNGQLNTREGCASISDANGNLLFYSDGTTVWNRNHTTMQNGNGLFGDASSTQSAIIVAKPNDPDIYYIFTVDNSLDGSNFGLNYSEVDMTQDSGLGAVTTKNVNLLSFCSEKVTAVLKDCVTKSLWVITFASQNGTPGNYNTYHAYEVTDTGINTTAVTSTFGISINDARGYLKFSPDGTKMVSANMNEGLFLYDFDVNTGIVSNELALQLNGNTASYGVEFSPNNQLLYVHASNDYFNPQNGNDPANHFSTLSQFNLAAVNIQGSQIILDTRSLYRGGLQLGPDGRIYRALSSTYNTGQPFLGVINNPNTVGAGAGYQHNAISLNGRNSTQGLPPFDQSLFNSKIDIIQNGVSIINLDLCTNDTYTLMAEDIAGASYSWTMDGNPLSEADFDLVVTQDGHYEVFIDPNNGDCAIEGEAFVSYSTYPVANQPSDMVVCDDDNNALWTFDFSTQDAQVLNAQAPSTYEVKYFETQADADANANEIIGMYDNLQNPQQIFVRAQNSGNPNCYDTTSFFIEIFNTPTANPLNDFIECDNDADGNDANGQSEFDLISLNATVLGTQSPTAFAISYHTSQTDADSGNNPIANPYYNTTPFQEQIFVRIENVNNTSCYDTSTFNITVNPIPQSVNTNLIQCDEDGIPEGFTLFNLNEANALISGGNTNYTISHYLSQADAQNSMNAIDGSAFNNFLNPQVIYVQVTDPTTGCFDIAELTLEVSLTDTNDVELIACDDDGLEDGFFNFSLSDADADVLNGTPAGVSLFYYESYEEALLEQNPLGTNYTNTNPYSQIIYARAENANACYGISQITLTINELPDVQIEDEAYYCLNFFPQTITIDGGVRNDAPSNYYYLWSTGQNASEIEINAPGIYSVRVSNTEGCYKDRTVRVWPSNIADITEIKVVDAASNNMVTVIVSGEGDYQYALDDVNGPYQDSHVFEDVVPGFHTVFVRDKNGCGVIDEIVSVIGFPKYFTPNSDGFHDTWQVKGISRQFQPNTKVIIYDRFGKLLAQIDPLGRGWDGNHNGNPLPTSDYWFAVALQDGRIYKNHFTLKR